MHCFDQLPYLTVLQDKCYSILIPVLIGIRNLLIGHSIRVFSGNPVYGNLCHLKESSLFIDTGALPV